MIGGTENAGTYIRCGDYYTPDIRLPEESTPLAAGDECIEIISKNIIQPASMTCALAVNCGCIWQI